MDVRLPDGTVIKGVPENTTKADLVARLQRNGMTVPPEWTQDVKPKAPGASGPERLAAGLADQVHGGAQLLENAVRAISPAAVDKVNQFNNWLAEKGLVAPLPVGGVDQQVREREQALKSDGIDWWRTAGNLLSPVNLAGGGLVAGAKAPLLMSAGAGGASAALMPAENPEEKLKQVSLGGVGGVAAPLLMRAAGRAISPKASTNPDVQALMAEGVKPTAGQVLGGRWNAAEEKLQSLPLMGDMIANARRSAQEQFNRAAINRASGKVGTQVDEIGQAGVKKAGDAISQAYDDALASLKVVKFDGQFQRDLQQLRSMTQALTPDMSRKFGKQLRDTLGGRVSPANGMTAETMKKVDSELGQVAARYGSSSVASEQELGDALKQLQALLREQVARNSPDASKAVKAADAGWANLVRVEGAAKAAKNSDGVFTPAQLNMAIQQADKSTRKRAVARGDALMQDLGSAGQNVLGNKVPNSGTFDRAALGAGGLASYFIDPLIPAGLVGGSALYTPQAQALLRGLLTKRPESAKKVAGLLDDASPMLAPAGGLLLLDALK